MKRSEPPLQPAAGEGLREFYLKRLERLVNLRRRYEEQLNHLGLELIERSIYATYRDCVSSGCGPEAKSMLGGRVPRPFASEAP